MSRLTPQEVQEIKRCLAEDKPLPDKYRYLIFGDKLESELVWNGKSSNVCGVVLPFQVIEHIEDKLDKNPRQPDLPCINGRGGEQDSWSNKLIWGDNKLILSSIKNGPMRAEIERHGGIKLIYIDPPFDVGADFTMEIDIGDESSARYPGILEETAYRDIWGGGADSYNSMIYERLCLMKDLLADDGSIFVHCDWRVNWSLRAILNEIFGHKNFKNEIIWKRKTGRGITVHEPTNFGFQTDSIFFYSKSKKNIFNEQKKPLRQKYIDEFYRYTDSDGRRYRIADLSSPSYSPTLVYEYKGYKPPNKGWAISLGKMIQWDKEGRLYFPQKKGGRIQRKRYLDENEGESVQNLWDDISSIPPNSEERLDYPTQKPEALLDRIIKTASNEGNIVADFFCGSGTLAAVAEKLGRKWIASDLGKFAVHTTRKRLLGVQRALKDAGRPYRACEVLSLGRYERQYHLSVNPNLSPQERLEQLKAKEACFRGLVLRAYKAEKAEGLSAVCGKKGRRMVSVGPVDIPVGRLFVSEVISESVRQRISGVDILGFEFEMGLIPDILAYAKEKGVDLSVKYIPQEVFDIRAVEKDRIYFHDVSHIGARAHIDRNTVSVELTNYSLFFSQDNLDLMEASLKKGASKAVIHCGQLINVSKDKQGVIKRKTLTTKWSDWVDYWAVDFNFESKREIITVKNPETGELVEKWTGGYIFQNEWQMFRTKNKRSMELKSVFHEYEKDADRKKIAVKVVDVLGNDTMTWIEISLKGRK